MTKLLTNSRLKTARLCSAKHNFSYILGYRPIADSEELDFGTAIHHALYAWWSVVDPETSRIDAALQALEQHIEDPFLKAKATAMLLGYDSRWLLEPYELVVAEQEFQGDICNPKTRRRSRVWSLAGKIDVIVRHTETGKYYLMEHKTSGEDVSPGSVYHMRLRMDSQVSTYYDGAAILGFPDIAGCIYDVLCKPPIRPLKATPAEDRKYTKAGVLYAQQRGIDEKPDEYLTRCADVISEKPEKYFVRLDVPRMESELLGARMDLWAQAARIHEDEVSGRAPRNVDACMSYGRICPYFGVCSGTASIEDPSLFRRVTNVHGELALYAEAPNQAPAKEELSTNEYTIEASTEAGTKTITRVGNDSGDSKTGVENSPLRN